MNWVRKAAIPARTAGHKWKNSGHPAGPWHTRHDCYLMRVIRIGQEFSPYRKVKLEISEIMPTEGTFCKQCERKTHTDKVLTNVTYKFMKGKVVILNDKFASWGKAASSIRPVKGDNYGSHK